MTIILSLTNNESKEEQQKLNRLLNTRGEKKGHDLLILTYKKKVKRRN